MTGPRSAARPRTSTEWWAETKRDGERLMTWLRKQYQGEVTAAERIERYCLDVLAADDPRRRVLLVIAEQERTHARWVGELLRARGETPRVVIKTERYWTQTLGRIRSFADAAGVAHHAETMRLERIAVIAGDEDAPADVRATFARILPDESSTRAPSVSWPVATRSPGPAKRTAPARRRSGS